MLPIVDIKFFWILLNPPTLRGYRIEGLFNAPASWFRHFDNLELMCLVFMTSRCFYALCPPYWGWLSFKYIDSIQHPTSWIPGGLLDSAFSLIKN